MTDVFFLTIQHLQLSLAGVLLAALFGIPGGILASHIKILATVILACAEVFQVFPSLALLAVLLYFFGLSDNTLIAALFFYSLLPIINNTLTGFHSISRSLYEIAAAVGMNRRQVFFKLQLPLSLPHIINGLRIALITAIGITTIGVLVGAGGLGKLIWRGIQTRNTQIILSGAIPAALLAVFSDHAMHYLEIKLTPWVNRQLKDL